MPADEKDSAATNRLLDLLRSQQAGKSTTEGNASGTLDTQADPDSTQSASETQTAPEQGAASVSSSIVPETISDQPPPQAENSQPVTSEEIMDKLGRGSAKDQKSAPPGSGQVDSAAQGTAAAFSESADPQDSQVKARGAHADQADPDEKVISDISVADPGESRIDPDNFQVSQDVQPPNQAIDLLYEFSNWALGIRQKITVQCSSDCIRIMKMRSVGSRNIIYGMDEYRLPYEVDDRKITHRSDLLSHILDSLDKKVWKKDTMFRTYSSQIETHTKVFKAPPVKGKEFAELITWSAKKNLPFSSENINIDYQVLGSEKGEIKKNIIIGVGNNETISHLGDLYRKRKFDLQSVSTIPYLDWQTFKHCYPDRLGSCIAIVHMNKSETTITMVRSGRMEFNREMSVGVKDYQKALVQRVMVGNDAVNITEDMATDYLMRYGIPIETTGDIPETGISLYKISIFLRPVIERMTGEINRSLDYFRKQVADVECQEIYITGPGAAIPNLVETFGKQLERTTEHLNPLRQGDFEFKDQMDFDYQLIPIFSTNFALALKRSTGINLLPARRKQHFQYRMFNKFALFIASILIPLYIILGYFAHKETGYMEESVATMNKQWRMLSEKSQEYFAMLADLEYLGSYWGFMTNDRVNSDNQIKLLKLISSEIPDNIKVTSLVFRPASNQGDGKTIKQDVYIDRIAMSGFVNASAGIADIQLTNFIMRLESLNMFTSIDREIQGNPSSDDVRLFFTLKIGVSVK